MTTRMLRRLTVCTMLLLAACGSPSHDNVEKWRNTEEGPKRLAKVVEDSSVDMRIDNKRIDEGDVFHLCDYELRFTYRA